MCRPARPGFPVPMSYPDIRAVLGSERHIGPSLLRWPIEQDRDRCAGRIEVGLTRGRLRPPRPMRLDISCWSPSSARTVLELIPAQRVRPTPGYFRSGHLLLDNLTHSLLRHAGAEWVKLSSRRWPDRK